LIEQVSNPDAIRDAMQSIKSGATGFSTSWFYSPEATQKLIDRQELQSLTCANTLLLFRKDRGFLHVYHISSDFESLRTALQELESMNLGVPLVADLIGRAQDLEKLRELYSSQGFKDYRTLVRMSRITSPGDAAVDATVLVASPSEAPAVLAFFEELLDPYSEQIPDLEQIQSACSAENVLIVRNNGQLGGVLLYESTGVTTVLRYWFVAKDAQNKGIGARLIKSMFRRCADGKRTLLWVFGDNDDAIVKYEHYGFRRDDMRDLIMIRSK
jgi:GNAT superfamily N-acetyltransferase